jgi:acyl-CoA synthetase (AMP-forming)/AMP-acid ligase II
VLAEVVREAAKRFGDATAVVAEDGWAITYRQLDQLSDEVAAGLERRGLGEGSVVALALPSIPEYLVAYVGGAKAGLITAGVNARLAEPERDAVVRVAEPALVVATTELAPANAHSDVLVVEPANDASRVLPELRVKDASPSPLAPDPDRPVALVFTSGTTGTPKGALFGNRQLAAITAIDVGDRWGGGGRSLSGTSLAHLGPMTKLAGNLRGGGVMFLTRRWRAGDALERIERDRLTSLGGIPTQLALMMADPDFDQRDLSSVRAVVIGGGPATAALVREARQRFGAPLAVRYSCTEAGIGTGTAFDDPDEDAEVSVGRPQRGVELTIVDDDGEPVPSGEVGAVCLRSGAVMSGYFRDPAATAAAFTPAGAVRTGDLGWIDEQGRLRLAGRAVERYVRGGYNVYPAEVEGVLAEHPAVASVAVVSRPDDVMGEVGVAFVVARAGAAPPHLDDVRAFAAAKLARYKLPEDLRVVGELPLTPMDKVDRRELRRQLGGSA